MKTCGFHYESGGKCNDAASPFSRDWPQIGKVCVDHNTQLERERTDLAPDPVHHPAHYKQGGVEVIDAIEAWELGFCLGNTVKYVARAGKKDAAKTVEDLKKARWYLDREIGRLGG